MLEHSFWEDDLTLRSRRHVLYSCRYEQQLYRKQNMCHEQMVTSWRCRHGNQNIGPSTNFDHRLSSCECGLCFDSRGRRNVIMQDIFQTEQLSRKLRHRRFEMMLYCSDRSMRRKQRLSIFAGDQSRRRRFPTLAQRKAANIREQRRMINLKDAFKTLRECLPTFSYEKKMSRIETLRLAIAYINFLRKLLGDAEKDTLSISNNQSETGREC